MTVAGVADRPATSVIRDLLGAVPVAVLRATGAALAVAAVGQLPPSLFNVAGGGLALETQLRVGWLYTMAGHAVEMRVTGSGGSIGGLSAPVIGVRFGLLTIAALAAVMLLSGGRAAARRVDDLGVRRIVAGALVAPPYAVLIGGINTAVILALHTGGGFLPSTMSVAAPTWEGFAFPAAIAVVAGALGGWSISRSWRSPFARVVKAGLRAFAWATGLSFVGLLAFAALRPEGLERYSLEVWSGGPERALVYVGHQALVLPNQAMWILAPSMGGCVSLRTDPGAHDVVCLDRLPRAPDPATWLLSELGRVEGASPTAPMPDEAWLFVAVPVASIALGFRRLGRTAGSIARAIVWGVGGGLVFGATVVAASIAGSLWLTVQEADAMRIVALGPDPITTAVLAVAWGTLGGAVVSSAGVVARRADRRSVSRRA